LKKQNKKIKKLKTFHFSVEVWIEIKKKELGQSGSSSPLKLTDSQKLDPKTASPKIEKTEPILEKSTITKTASPKIEKTEISTPKIDSPKQSRPVETPKKEIAVNAKKEEAENGVYFLV